MGREPSDAPTLSALLDDLMAERGLKLRQLARQAQMSAATLHRWRRGTSLHPNQRPALLNVAKTLGLSRVQTNRLLRAAELGSLDAVAASAAPEEQELLRHWSARPRNNLPAALTSFVGRAGEVAEVAELLGRPDVRLVTLTGPGGSGKTRLALRVAEEALDSFPDGVFLVPLAAVSDPALVILSIAETIGLRDVPDAALAARLSGWLAARGRRVLLVLDNLEQIVDCGPAISDLLREAPGLKVLATSRVSLRLSGEYVWQVAPFPLPEPSQPRRAQWANPAVVLFVQRARAANPRRTLQDDDDLKAIIEICTRLDGLPLAIELAAAGTREREPWRLLADFPSRLDLGSDGPRDVATRQQTLRATIAWSVDLLPEPARVLLARLSVFAGGWSEAAARAVCLLETSWERRHLAGPPSSPSTTRRDTEPEGIAQILATLVDASLIERVPSPLDGTRYRILETIREYAQERLTESCQTATLRERHARYFLDLAESAPPYVPDVRAGNWYERVDTDIANLRAALTWAEAHDDISIFARFTAALWPYWHEYRRVVEGRRWLGLALARQNRVPVSSLVAILTGSAALASAQTAYLEARRFAQDAIAHATREEDRRSRAIALQHLGYANSMVGLIAEAMQTHETQLQQWRVLGDACGISCALSDLCMTATISGDLVGALPYLREQMELCCDMHDAPIVGRALRDQGLHALLSGDVVRAAELLREGVERLRAANSYILGGTIFYLGTALCFAGRLDDAVACYTESLQIHEAIGDQMLLALTILGFAAVAHRQGDGLRAARLCGAAQALLAASRTPLPPAVAAIYERESAIIRDLIGDRAFQDAFVAGSELTLAEELAYAREATPSTLPPPL